MNCLEDSLAIKQSFEHVGAIKSQHRYVSSIFDHFLWNKFFANIQNSMPKFQTL